MYLYKLMYYMCISHPSSIQKQDRTTTFQSAGLHAIPGEGDCVSIFSRQGSLFLRTQPFDGAINMTILKGI